jgi:hypothetical protein
VLDLVGAVDHRAELEHREALAAASDARLGKQHRTTAVEPDGDRQHQQRRPQDDQPDCRPVDVHRALEAVRRSGQAELPDPEQPGLVDLA